MNRIGDSPRATASHPFGQCLTYVSGLRSPYTAARQSRSLTGFPVDSPTTCSERTGALAQDILRNSAWQPARTRQRDELQQVWLGLFGAADRHIQHPFHALLRQGPGGQTAFLCGKYKTPYSKNRTQAMQRTNN